MDKHTADFVKNNRELVEVLEEELVLRDEQLSNLQELIDDLNEDNKLSKLQQEFLNQILSKGIVH